MQIHSIHNSGHKGVTPHGLRPGTAASASGSVNSVPHDSEAGGAATTGELDHLTRLLGEFSEVRADVVAEAKVRVQRGDYLTRASAEATADALLSKDAQRGLSVTD